MHAGRRTCGQDRRAMPAPPGPARDRDLRPVRPTSLPPVRDPGSRARDRARVPSTDGRRTAHRTRAGVSQLRIPKPAGLGARHSRRCLRVALDAVWHGVRFLGRLVDGPAMVLLRRRLQPGRAGDLADRAGILAKRRSSGGHLRGRLRDRRRTPCLLESSPLHPSLPWASRGDPGRPHRCGGFGSSGTFCRSPCRGSGSLGATRSEDEP